MAKKKKIPVFLIVIIIAVICLALIIIFKSKPTGSAVYVNYYGLSDTPLDEGAGKIQTKVRITQPTLKEMGRINAKVVEVAGDILEVTNFENSLVELYNRNPPAAIQESTEAITNGADSLIKEFKENTKCLTQIGKAQVQDDVAEFIIVTKLNYYNCDDYYEYNQYNDWMAAIATHTFYTDDGEIICTQESYPLFTISKGTGELSSNIAGC